MEKVKEEEMVKGEKKKWEMEKMMKWKRGPKN